MSPELKLLALLVESFEANKLSISPEFCFPDRRFPDSNSLVINAERLRDGEPFVVLNPHSFIPVEEGEVLVLTNFIIHPGVPRVDECGAPDHTALP